MPSNTDNANRLQSSYSKQLKLEKNDLALYFSEEILEMGADGLASWLMRSLILKEKGEIYSHFFHEMDLPFHEVFRFCVDEYENPAMEYDDRILAFSRQAVRAVFREFPADGAGLPELLELVLLAEALGETAYARDLLKILEIWANDPNRIAMLLSAPHGALALHNLLHSVIRQLDTADRNADRRDREVPVLAELAAGIYRVLVASAYGFHERPDLLDPGVRERVKGILQKFAESYVGVDRLCAPWPQEPDDTLPDSGRRSSSGVSISADGLASIQELIKSA